VPTTASLFSAVSRRSCWLAAPFRFVQISVAIAAFVNGSKDSIRYPICSPASKNCSFAGAEWMVIVLWLVVAMFAQF
jgi:hypothetical protein